MHGINHEGYVIYNHVLQDFESIWKIHRPMARWSFSVPHSSFCFHDEDAMGIR